MVRKNGVRQAIKLLHPELYDVIFSPKREAGLELLNQLGRKYVDYGCGVHLRFHWLNVATQLFQ